MPHVIPDELHRWHLAGYEEDPRRLQYRALGSNSLERLRQGYQRAHLAPRIIAISGDTSKIDKVKLKRMGDLHLLRGQHLLNQ